MKQLSKRQVRILLNSNVFNTWTNEQIVGLQLFQENVCVDIGVFFEALNVVLKRQVYFFEYSNNLDGLRREYLNLLGVDAEIELDYYIRLIPLKKRIELGLSNLKKKIK